MSDSSLQNIITNYFNNIEKTSKPNDSDKVYNEEPKPNTDLSNVENFMNVVNMLSKTKEHDTVEYTTEAKETSTAFIPKTTTSQMLSDYKNMEYINKILENFIAMQTMTTTNRPITKQVDYDLIAQKVKEILEKTSNKHMQRLIPSAIKSTTVVEENVTDQINEEIEVLHNDSVQNKDDIMKLTNSLKLFGPVKDKNTSSRDKYFKDKSVSYQSKRQYLEDGVSPITIIANSPNQNRRYNNITKQINTLSEDIIREISENVKARVLQDLKNEITTTTKKPTPTTKQTTVKTKTTTVIPGSQMFSYFYK